MCVLIIVSMVFHITCSNRTCSEAKRKLEDTQAQLKLEHLQEIEEITADHKMEIDVSWVQWF